MKRYVALLRGINVSGQKRIKMADLRAHLADLHFQNIQTYVQSGNVIFESDGKDKADLARQIEKKILEKYGFEVVVLVKSGNELKYVLENNPFINERTEDTSRLYVTFLLNQPAQQLCDKLEDVNYSPEEFIINDETIFFFSPNGYGKAKMSNNFFELKLKVSASTRNWNTINKLVAMLEA